MIRSLLVLTFAFAFHAQAQMSNVTDATKASATTMKTEDVTPELADLRNRTEVGYMVTSLNSGTNFANVGILRRISENFELGLRGLVPIDFDRQNQIYIGQAFVRYDMVNAENVFYLEGSLFQGMLTDYSTDLFAGFGGTYGYRRAFTEELSAGANIGVDYSSGRIVDDRLNYNWTLMSRLGIVGAYNF
jgi:hypothetical protein